MNATEKCLFLEVIHVKATVSITFTAITTSIINVITSLTAMVGNSMILYIILKNERLQTPPNLLLGSLSITDFLVGLIVQPSSAIRRISESRNNHNCVVRIIFSYFGFLCAGASVLNITLISIDRALAIIFPFRYEASAENRTHVSVVSLVWTIWSVFTLMPFVNILSSEQFFLGAGVIIGVSVILVLTSYGFIYRAILSQRRLVTPVVATEASDQQTQKRGKHPQMACTLAIVIGMFLFCYLPQVIVLVLRGILGDSASLVYLGDAWADLFVFVNSSINPLIYCYRIREFKEAMISIFRRMKIKQVSIDIYSLPL